MSLKKHIDLIVINLFTFLVLIFNNSCNTTEPPLPPPPEKPKTIKLELLDVSLTEAFIKVEALSDTILPARINLKKNNLVLYSFTLTSKDTVIADTTLQANTSYTYKAVIVINGEEGEDGSDTLMVKTLAVTSHNFTWQKYTFGVGASSILSDVAIIDENNIWAVGKIYMNDSTGNPDPHAYNAVHWDGNKWELRKIFFYTICGQSNLSSYPAGAVFAFNDGKILISSTGDKIAIIKDGVQIDKFCLPSNLSMAINKIWGTSSSDYYVVGKSGSIAHYSNGTWTKIESGTNIGFVDIWGDTNPLTGKTEIICGAYYQFPTTESDLIRIKEDNTTERVDITGLGSSFGGVWFKSGKIYYTVGGGLYERKFNSDGWVDLNQGMSITHYYMQSIRGTGINDIMVVASYGEVLHYNGQSWISIKNAETTLTYGAYFRVSLKADIIAATGYDGDKAVILIGHHL